MEEVTPAAEDIIEEEAPVAEEEIQGDQEAAVEECCSGEPVVEEVEEVVVELNEE